MTVGCCPVCELALHDADEMCTRCGRPLVEPTPPMASGRWFSWPVALAVLCIASTLALAVSGRVVTLLVALVGRN